MIKDSLIYNVLKIIFPLNEVFKPVKLGRCLISEGICTVGYLTDTQAATVLVACTCHTIKNKIENIQ